VAWEVDRENPDDAPISINVGEAIVMLNRVGVTLEEAVHQRAPVEVEALLLSQIAEWEARRKKTRSEGIPIHVNRPGEAAPGWVNELPEEEG
jgi:hypothetical protein